MMRLGKLMDKIAELRFLQECYSKGERPAQFESEAAMIRHMNRIANIEVGYIPPKLPKRRRDKI